MIEQLICFECGAPSVMIREEPKYNGKRGICLNCGGEWPES